MSRIIIVCEYCGHQKELKVNELEDFCSPCPRCHEDACIKCSYNGQWGVHPECWKPPIEKESECLH